VLCRPQPQKQMQAQAMSSVGASDRIGGGTGTGNIDDDFRVAALRVAMQEHMAMGSGGAGHGKATTGISTRRDASPRTRRRSPRSRRSLPRHRAQTPARGGRRRSTRTYSDTDTGAGDTRTNASVDDTCTYTEGDTYATGAGDTHTFVSTRAGDTHTYITGAGDIYYTKADGDTCTYSEGGTFVHSTTSRAGDTRTLLSETDEVGEDEEESRTQTVPTTRSQRSRGAVSVIRDENEDENNSSSNNSWHDDLREYHKERDDPQNLCLIMERAFLGCDSFSTSSLDKMCGVGPVAKYFVGRHRNVEVDRTVKTGCRSYVLRKKEQKETSNKKSEQSAEKEKSDDFITEARSSAADDTHFSTSLSKHERRTLTPRASPRQTQRQQQISNTKVLGMVGGEGGIPKEIGCKSRFAVRMPSPTTFDTDKEDGEKALLVLLPKPTPTPALTTPSVSVAMKQITSVGGVVGEWRRRAEEAKAPSQEQDQGPVPRQDHQMTRHNPLMTRNKYHIEDHLMQEQVAQSPAAAAVVSARGGEPEGYGTIYIRHDECDFRNSSARNSVSPLTIEPDDYEAPPLDQHFFGNGVMDTPNNINAAVSSRRGTVTVEPQECDVDLFLLDTSVAASDNGEDSRHRHFVAPSPLPHVRPESPSGLTCASDEPSRTTQQMNNKSHRSSSSMRTKNNNNNINKSSAGRFVSAGDSVPSFTESSHPVIVHQFIDTNLPAVQQGGRVVGRPAPRGVSALFRPAANHASVRMIQNQGPADGTRVRGAAVTPPSALSFEGQNNEESSRGPRSILYSHSRPRSSSQSLRSVSLGHYSSRGASREPENASSSSSRIASSWHNNTSSYSRSSSMGTSGIAASPTSTTNAYSYRSSWQRSASELNPESSSDERNCQYQYPSALHEFSPATATSTERTQIWHQTLNNALVPPQSQL
jgi:hypothetical protein